MILQPRHFVRFIDGRAGNKVAIAYLADNLGKYLRTVTTDVSLRLDYAQKLNRRHQMTYEGFSEIQNTIDRGYCLQSDQKHLQFIWMKEQFKPEIYFLLLKSTSDCRELWLVTFHRLKRPQLNARLRSGQIVRDHDGDFAG